MTSSELMIDTLTKFGDAEAAAVIVIWTDTNGDVQAVSNASKTHVIGMCEFTKLSTFRTMEPK